MSCWLSDGPTATHLGVTVVGLYLEPPENAIVLGVDEQSQVQALVTAIGTFIHGWNERCHPFVWSKTADEILPHATRQRYSAAGHNY